MTRERPPSDAPPPVVWDAARFVLAVARNGSANAAAQVLGIDHTTVGRKIRALEAVLGVALFVREGPRLVPSVEGAVAIMEAEKMEAHALSLLRKVSSHRAHLSGELRVNATEGLGTLWLMPRLESFQVRHPNLAINLMTTNSHVLDVVDDCDIAIYWQRPIRNGIVSRVLGSVGFSLFAAPEYLARYGTPACFEELANHKVLHFNGYELNPGLDRWVRLMREIKPSMRIESSAASAPLIVGGRYITLYPNYVRLLGHSFVQVPFQTDISLEVWLAFHEDRRRDPRVRALASEIGELAKADRGTWFS